jgi:hypothetical protein
MWLCIDFEALLGNGPASRGHSLVVFCKVDAGVLPLFALFSLVFHPLRYHRLDKQGLYRDVWVVRVHVEQVQVSREILIVFEVSTVELFHNLFSVSSFVFQHLY